MEWVETGRATLPLVDVKATNNQNAGKDKNGSVVDNKFARTRGGME